MGLMNLRNSPIRGIAFPAQILLGHQIQDNLPSVAKLHDQPMFSRDIHSERLRSKEQYDKHVSPQNLSTFQPNQQVAIQNTDTKEWSQRGRIVEETSPRSFIIELDNGKQIRRNRQLIRKVYQISMGSHETVQDIDEVDAEIVNQVDAGHANATVEEVAENDNLMEVENNAAEENDVSSGSETEAYEQSGSDWDSEDATIRHVDENYMDMDEEQTVSSKGRKLKKRVPLDYEDI